MGMAPVERAIDNPLTDSAEPTPISARPRLITRSRNAFHIGGQGEIHDHSSDDQHYRIAGPNQLPGIVIHCVPPSLTKRSHNGNSPT